MPQMPDSRKRCPWCNVKNPVYVTYHDNEWGLFPTDEKSMYELFMLETFQAGLSWECVLNKRENFRTAYDGFDIDKICLYDSDKVEELLKNPGIIRNRAKIEASISNSRIYKDIAKEFNGFDAYIKIFCRGRTFSEQNPEITTNSLSDAISSDLKRREMRFVGSTTIYAFLQAIGIVKSHQKDCFRYQEDEAHTGFVIFE